MRLLQKFAVLMLALCLGMPGCDHPPQEQGPRYEAAPAASQVPVYVLAVHPLHNPRKLFQAYQPLVAYLNGRVPGAEFKLEASLNYGDFEAKVKARAPHILLPNPWQTIKAMQVGYSVIATAGDSADFKGLILVRRDSHLQSLADLKGKAVSYPSRTALAACMMPQYLLHQHGIQVTTDLENRYVGSQESSIMNAYLGLTAAGATWPPPWRAFQKDHPEEAKKLKVLGETASLINPSVMVRNDVPPEVREGLRQALIHLQDTQAGRDVLASMEMLGFYPATDADYGIVRSFVSRFEKEVRPVEGE
jgi:phosphonate transport system substrate-binding protein